MNALPVSDLGPCEQCDAERWRTERPALVPATAAWLRSGGTWRPSRPVCAGCGAPGPSTAWLVRWDDDASRLTLPSRVVREVARTIGQERTAVPAPWLHLASAATGGAVGVGAAVASRSGRPLLAGAVGAASGALTCWSVFASTALRRPSTWFELRLAVQQQVAPERAAALRAARDDAVVRSGSSPAYGLADWAGSRVVVGHRSEGAPPRLTSVALAHGEPLRRDLPWLVVDTADRLHDEEHGDAQLADDLWDDASGAHDVDLSGLDDAAVLAHLHEVRRARAARPEPQWHERAVLVDGRRVPVRWAGEGGSWVARALLADASVTLRAHDLPLEDVVLVRLPDLDAYASWSP